MFLSRNVLWCRIHRHYYRRDVRNKRQCRRERREKAEVPGPLANRQAAQVAIPQVHAITTIPTILRTTETNMTQKDNIAYPGTRGVQVAAVQEETRGTTAEETGGASTRASFSSDYNPGEAFGTLRPSYGGDGGTGADGVRGSKYGQSGSGGGGGGGGGGTASASLNVRASATFTVRKTTTDRAYVRATVNAYDSKPGSGGAGGKGGAGADGCIILYYGVTTPVQDGQLKDKNGLMLLDKYGRRLIV